MNFFVKCLIMFRATQKNAYFTLVVLTAIIIIAYIKGNTQAVRYGSFSAIILVLCILLFSLICMIHRKKCQRFKVYLSFSELRIPYLAQYITLYLRPSFWLYNIDYYDFREHKRFHYLNEFAVCKEIDKHLADSDIFLRFIGEGLEPNKIRLIKGQRTDIRFNPFTRSLTGNIDYTKYEVDASFDKFGFTNPSSRFQIVPLEIMVTPMKHIKTIFIDSRMSALDLALVVINKLSHGYLEQVQRMRSDFFWRMRDKINN